MNSRFINIKPLACSILITLPFSLSAQEALPKGLLEPCEKKGQSFELLNAHLNNEPDFPKECKAAIEGARDKCKEEPVNQGLPEAGAGGANSAAKTNTQAVETARDKYQEHKKGCEEATKPIEKKCRPAIREINQQRNQAQDETEKSKQLRRFERVRDAIKASLEASDLANRCSSGYAQIYEDAAIRSRSIASQTEDSTQFLDGGGNDPAVKKAAESAGKDAFKQALKSVSKEAAKFVPGGTVALELADGNLPGAAKEVAKELIPFNKTGKIAYKAAELSVVPGPAGACSSRHATPVHAYQSGCTYYPQTAGAAIQILSQD